MRLPTTWAKGYTSDGRDNDVTVFDLKTLQVLTKIKTGQNPDAIIYEPVTHRVFTLNGRSKDSTAIDAKTGDVITASIPLGGKPEFAQIDGKGHVFVNIEDTNEIVTIDAKNALVTKRYSIAPCDGPSGLAIDPKKGHLFSVCGNKMMVVSDPATGKVIATPAIGAGTDGVAFDDGYAFSANGGDSQYHDGWRNFTGQIRAGWRPSRPCAARAPSDPIRRPISSTCPLRKWDPRPIRKDGKKGRPQPTPNSFMILVVGR